MKLRVGRGNKTGGYVLLLTLVQAMALLIALMGIIELSLFNYSSARRSIMDNSALDVAEAGADVAVFHINQDVNYAGTNTTCPIATTGSNPVSLFNDTTRGKGTYETCVTNGSIANEKVIYSVGKVYMPGATSPIAIRKIRLLVEGSYSGAYSLQTGPGGLTLTNSATISNGPVYVGGALTMSNTSAIGSPTSPIAVSVADYLCPSPATSAFPQLCGSGNPISISNAAHIYGNVQANNQTNNSGMSNPGLTASSGVAPPSLPGYDRASQKAAVATSMSGSAASCTNNGSVTWPANVHITSDVTVSHNCTVIMQGNAWISGNLSLTQKGVIKPADTVSTQPTIMVDGSSGVSLNQQSVIASNSGNIGVQLITFYSTASCSPDCTSVTGTDLYNSQGLTTISINNQGADPGGTFYARWTNASLGQGGTIGAIMGQSVSLANSGTLSFTSTTTTGTLTWDVRYYEQL